HQTSRPLPLAAISATNVRYPSKLYGLAATRYQRDCGFSAPRQSYQQRASGKPRRIMRQHDAAISAISMKHPSYECAPKRLEMLFYAEIRCAISAKLYRFYRDQMPC